MKAKENFTNNQAPYSQEGSRVKILNGQLIKIAALVKPTLPSAFEKKGNGVVKTNCGSLQQDGPQTFSKTTHQKKTRRHGYSNQSIPIKL